MKFYYDLINFLKDKKTRLFVILIAIGIILILFSKSFSKTNTNVNNEKENLTTEDYITTTEEKLKTALSKMLSGKEVDVMITIDNGIEYVYASENKSDNDLVQDTDSEYLKKTQQSDSNEKTYKTIKDIDGNETPLIVSEIMPKIRGVFVVCEDTYNDVTKDEIKSAVQTVLDISSDKIFVTSKH